MYTRTAILLAAVAGITNGQMYCFTCTNSQPLGSATEGTNGKCYFTSLLNSDTTDVSTNPDMTTCHTETADANGDPVFTAGMCFMKIETVDGIPQSIERGCVANGATAPTDAEIATATGLPSGHAQGCDINVIDLDSGALTHLTGSVFNRNQDINELTDSTCGFTCTAGSTACNGESGNFGLDTLSDCNAQCGDDRSVINCDHWAGICRDFNCPTNQQASLTGSPQVYTCATVDCEAASSTLNDPDPLCGAGNTCVIGNTAALFSDFVTPYCVCPTATDTWNTDGTCTPAAVTQGSATTNRKCVQCSSDTQSSGCNTGSVTATECGTATQKCAAVSTLWIDSDGKSIREVVERGCTDDAVTNDVCEFQEINSGSIPGSNQASFTRFSGATEMTCRYVCDEDGCNSELADGQDDYMPAIMCNVGEVCDSLATCKSQTGTIASIITASTTEQSCMGKCFSKMKYLQHLRTDGTYERAMTHLEFGCDYDSNTMASTMEDQHQCEMNAITYDGTGFTSVAQTDIISGVRAAVMQYECTTVMSEKVSNWPGQPMCFQCASSDTDQTSGALLTDTNSDHCYIDVAAASGCPNYWDNACYVEQSGLDMESNWAMKSMNPYSSMQTMGAYRSIARGCTSAMEAMWENEDAEATRDGDQNQNYYHNRKAICLDNMCNFGTALPAPGN